MTTEGKEDEHLYVLFLIHFSSEIWLYSHFGVFDFFFLLSTTSLYICVYGKCDYISMARIGIKIVDHAKREKKRERAKVCLYA